jgi:hypothetical protein
MLAQDGGGEGERDMSKMNPMLAVVIYEAYAQAMI